jgi:hypothetical protein
MGGQIIDATIVPRQSSARRKDEKAAIKEGRIPERWKDKPAKIRQKGRDARWSIKYTKAKVEVEVGADPKAVKPVGLATPMFVYKNHIGIGRTHGLIRTWVAGAANAHDGARLRALISPDNTPGEPRLIRFTARRRTRPPWQRACSPATSIVSVR